MKSYIINTMDPWKIGIVDFLANERPPSSLLDDKYVRVNSKVSTNFCNKTDGVRPLSFIAIGLSCMLKSGSIIAD
jgi:hypothetical protein